jgi:hypothetical protein
MKTKKENLKVLTFKRRKTATFFLTAAMILSALAILSIGTQPTYAASGSVTYDPTVFADGQSTLVVASGGTFTASSTVYFYVSSTDTFGSSSPQIGSYTLPTGATSLSNSVFHLTISETPGTYYIAASDDNRATFTSGSQITVTALSPSIKVASTVTAGDTATVTGSQFDPGSVIDIYLQYAGGQTLASSVSAATGNFSTTISIPSALYQTSSTYYVVAQEVSSSSLNSGITASASFTILPSISVSPKDVSISSSSTVVINGYGFSPGASISANSITLTAQSGSISGESNSATTVNTNGEFSATVSFDSAAANGGGVNVGIVTSPSSSSSSFTSAFYVSQQNATVLGFNFAVVPTTGSTYNVGDPFTATVYNFPASQTVDFYLGTTTVGSTTTDSNGFGQVTSTIPALPGNTYYPTAEVASMGLFKQSASLTISPDFVVSNPGNVMMTSNPSEYIPSNAVLTVAAYGLNPSSTYNLDDSLVASGGVYSSGSSNLETSISVGTASTSGIYPASNGTLIFSYSPSYTTKTTGSSATLTMTGSVSAYDGYSYGYKTIGTPSVSSPSSFGILSQGATGTNLVISGLIPFESPVYPGTSYYYSAFLGSASISVTYSSLTSTRIYASGGSFSGTFTVPYQPGLLDINVTYYGSSYSSNLTTQYVVISTESTSYSSGTLQVIPLSTAGTYEVVGNGYYNKNPKLYYTTYSGPQLEGTETLTNGAFAVQISPGTSTPAGTYSVFTELSNGGLTYFVYSSYTVTSNLTLVTASSGSTQIYSGPIGTALYVKASGLVPQSYYKVYFGGDLEITDTGTNLAAGTDTFDVPTSVPGTHTVTVVPVSSTTPVESAVFRVTSNPDLILVTDSNYAFPGQVILFTATDFTAPTLPTGATAAGLATTYATIELNSSDYQTVQATYSSSGKGFINGSFIMPNDNPGTYFELTITAFEVQPISYSIGTSPASTGYATVTLAYTGSQSDYLGLVSGNGALVTGISQSQIASLETDINTTLSVPVSQLDASVTSIQNSVAQITTSFGTMQASLNAINATVTSINAGVATLHTTLGQVTTSLSSLNSTVVALNGDTAKISTAVGIFSTTLNNINATVTLSNGNIATIKTDLGTFTGNVTSVSNGIATIQTSLGTITANTRSTAFPTGMFFILEIVILVLAVIAVAFSAVAMMNTRKKY